MLLLNVSHPLLYSTRPGVFRGYNNANRPHILSLFFNVSENCIFIVYRAHSLFLLTKIVHRKRTLVVGNFVIIQDTIPFSSLFSALFSFLLFFNSPFFFFFSPLFYQEVKIPLNVFNLLICV